MSEFLARAIALFIESCLWGLVGVYVAMEIFMADNSWTDAFIIPFLLIVLGFAILGPPLWRRFGLPKWYKGP